MDYTKLFANGVAVGTALTIPFYVTGYYPPDKQGEKHPPHEHVHGSTGNASAGSGYATVTAVSTAAFAPTARLTI